MNLNSEKALVSVTLAAILGPLFFHVSALTSARNMAPPLWLLTPLDQRLPLVPAAVWVYLSWYPAAFSVLFGGRDTFRRAAGAYILAFMACMAGYLTLPVTITRPSIIHADGLSLVTLRALYAFDPPVNVFPSFHAAVAMILWRLCPGGRLVSAAVSAWTIALCAACILTNQHYVLDVVAGLAVGAIALTIADTALSRLTSTWLAARASSRRGGGWRWWSSMTRPGPSSRRA